MKCGLLRGVPVECHLEGVYLHPPPLPLQCVTSFATCFTHTQMAHRWINWLQVVIFLASDTSVWRQPDTFVSSIRCMRRFTNTSSYFFWCSEGNTRLTPALSAVRDNDLVFPKG